MYPLNQIVYSVVLNCFDLALLDTKHNVSHEHFILLKFLSFMIAYLRSTCCYNWVKEHLALFKKLSLLS